MARHKKNIETLFRESEHKLTERPSSQAWRKLERKLENRRDRHRIMPYRYMSMAAALVALIAVVWVFGSVLNKTEAPTAVEMPVNFEIEELDLVNVSPSDINRRETDEYMKKFTSAAPQPAINEGNKEKTLMTAKHS